MENVWCSDLGVNHEVAPWVGNRIVIIGYTPDCLGKLSQEDLQQLHEHDFPVPLSQLPEFNGSAQVEGWNPYVRATQVDGSPSRQFECIVSRTSS